jgi:hypothetical protein
MLMSERTSERERLQELEAAVRGVMNDTSAPKQRVSHPRSTRPMLLVLLLIWAMIGWIWSTRPAFLFGERPAAVLSPEAEEATLRFALYLERARIESYVRRNGTLPERLEQAGPVAKGVAMYHTSDGYELVGQRRAHELRLTRAMDADSFLGNSLDVLRRGATAGN